MGPYWSSADEEDGAMEMTIRGTEAEFDAVLNEGVGGAGDGFDMRRKRNSCSKINGLCLGN